MATFGCPPRFVAMMWQFHDGIQALVQNDGEFCEPFEVMNGVKEDCVMAPTLFSMMFMDVRTETLVFQSGTVLMAMYRCKPNLRCRLMF